jgi:hypothetical protein
VFARLLHGAVALSLASEPSASETEPAAEPKVAEPSTDADAGTPEGAGDQPATDADASEKATTAEDAGEDTPLTDGNDPAGTEPSPGAEADAAEPSEDPGAEANAAEPSEEPASEEPAAEEAVATPPPATAAVRPIPGPADSGRRDDIVDKALLGGGVASLTLTAGLVGVTSWAWLEHNRAKRQLGRGVEGQERIDEQDRRDQMRTIGMITTAAAALYGTTGVVLLMLRARDRKKTTETALVPSPGGLSLVGRF